MKKSLGLISLILISLFIVLGFVIPQAIEPLPESLDLLLLLSLLIGSFITAILSEKGRLKIINVAFSLVGMFALLIIIIFTISMMLFGNFGT
ncbi:histidine kinase [Ferdinandcohnia sp. SAFN-114]|uniref:histidine kinase n=1 Tax=Ferdinandcohnia sp. SAFN-114 TaxID=3387275 RepID=UPI003F8216D7